MNVIAFTVRPQVAGQTLIGAFLDSEDGVVVTGDEVEAPPGASTLAVFTGQLEILATRQALPIPVTVVGWRWCGDLIISRQIARSPAEATEEASLNFNILNDFAVAAVLRGWPELTSRG